MEISYGYWSIGEGRNFCRDRGSHGARFWIIGIDLWEICLFHELTLRGFNVERQKSQPTEYKGLQIDEGYRLDLLSGGRIILELKVVDKINDVHYAQLLTYLKLSGRKLGYLINLNTTLLKHGR